MNSKNLTHFLLFQTEHLRISSQLLDKHHRQIFLPAGHGAAAEEGVGDRRRATRAHVAAAAAATQPPALLAAVGRQGLRASRLAPAARSEKPHGVSVRGPPKAQRRLVTISYSVASGVARTFFSARSSRTQRHWLHADGRLQPLSGRRPAGGAGRTLLATRPAFSLLPARSHHTHAI